MGTAVDSREITRYDAAMSTDARYGGPMVVCGHVPVTVPAVCGSSYGAPMCVFGIVSGFLGCVCGPVWGYESHALTS